MVDCLLSAGLEQRVTLAAALQQRTTLAAAVQRRTELASAVQQRQVLAAAAQQRTALAGAIQSRTVLAAAAQERTALTAEIDLGGVTGWDRIKLDSIEFGANRTVPDLVKLAYATEKSTSSNDSVDWPGTTSYQEVIQFLVPQPSWRANGYLEFDVTASFLNSAGAGTETVTFEVQRSATWPTSPGVDPSLFGLPQAWTSVASYQSGAINVGAGIGVFTFTLRIRANGHAGTTFRQAWSGEMIWQDLAGGEPGFRKFIGRTAMDVTNDLLFRLRFKTDFAPSSDPAFNVKSASAILVCPRDGADL